MKTSRYSDSQLLAILKQKEPGAKVADLGREHGMSVYTSEFFKRKQQRQGPVCRIILKQSARANLLQSGFSGGTIFDEGLSKFSAIANLAAQQ